MAARFWVGGTGTWDSSSTTHWAATSGGASGASVPGASDTVTFDGNSGGGTVTLNFGGPITIQSLTMGAFTGTWDNSVNNNNITMSLSGTAFSLTGSGARTINLGSATYTLSGANGLMNYATTTNMTLTASSSTISFTGTGVRQISHGGTITLGTVNIGAASSNGYFKFVRGGGTAPTITTLNVTAPIVVTFDSGTTYTITNAVGWSGSSVAQISFRSDNIGTSTTITVGASSAIAWAAFRDLTFSGSPVATNSFDLGNNSGITVTPPSVGGGSSATGAWINR